MPTPAFAGLLAVSRPARRGDRSDRPGGRDQPRHRRVSTAIWVSRTGDQRRDEAAIASFRRAIELQSVLAEAHNNLGIALRETAGSTRRSPPTTAPSQLRARAMPRPTATWAMPCKDRAGSTRRSPPIDRAIALRARLAEAHSNLGNALRDQGRLDEAIAACAGRSRSSPTWPRPTTTWAMP